MCDQAKFHCPCCGYLVFEQGPGFHQLCPICGWEDDLSQLRFPLMPGSANVVSLFEAQQNFQSYGASEWRKLGHTRDPVEGETVARGWRPLDPAGQSGTTRPRQPLWRLLSLAGYHRPLLLALHLEVTCV